MNFKNNQTVQTSRNQSELDGIVNVPWTCQICGTDNLVEFFKEKQICPVCGYCANSDEIEDAINKAKGKALKDRKKQEKLQRIKFREEILSKLIQVMDTVADKIALIIPNIIKVLKVLSISLLILAGICVIFLIIVGTSGIMNVGIVPMIQNIIDTNKYTSIITSIVTIFNFSSPNNSMRDMVLNLGSNIVSMYDTISRNIVNFTTMCFGG